MFGHMRQVADSTFALGTHGHNFYILKEGEEATIIDAGCSGEWSKLTSGLESVGLSLERIAGIIVTHSHTDHFGLAKRAKSSGVEVSVHEAEESRALGTYEGRYAVSPGELPKFSIYTLRTFVPMMLAGALKLEHLDEVSTFRDGDQLDLPTNPIAIHTPGHTEGHTMFHVPERGLLFTGDGLITMDLLGPSKGPQMIREMFNHDTAQALDSLDRIVDVEAELLLPGHGKPWSGSPAEAVELIRALRN